MMGIEELEDLSRVLQKTDVCSPLSVEANPIWYMLAHVKHANMLALHAGLKSKYHRTVVDVALRDMFWWA